MFYRLYVNSATNCYVLYADEYPNHKNPIKKRTLMKGCHIVCKRLKVPYMWAETQYYLPYGDYENGRFNFQRS